MGTNYSINKESSAGSKKVITIAVIVLLCIGFAFWLFKLSPENQVSSSSYVLDNTNIQKISELPPFDPSTDHYLGNANAKNVFVAYEDFQCPACASYNEILKQIPSQFPDTVFVYRYFPLTQIHKNAVVSSLAAEAAGAQGKYWEMHDLLFKNQSKWAELADPLTAFAEYAQQAGVVNIDQFKTDITSEKYKPLVQKQNNEAIGLALEGTPTFFFNGHKLLGGDLESMKKQAEQWFK